MIGTTWKTAESYEFTAEESYLFCIVYLYNKHSVHEAGMSGFAHGIRKVLVIYYKNRREKE
jgi:hypothetical protein